MSPSNTAAMTTPTVLDQVRIASPCNARWEDMTGDERTRFCGQCSKHVYNFSAMTRVEVEMLIREKDGRLCGRFYRRSDGRMLTTDCPTGVRRRRNRLARFGSAVFAAVMFIFGGCSSRREPRLMGEIAVPQPLMGDVCVPQPAQTNPPVIMGKISVAPTTASPPQEK